MAVFKKQTLRQIEQLIGTLMARWNLMNHSPHPNKRN